MKLSLVYLLIFVFALLNGDTFLFAAKHASVGRQTIQQSLQHHISNSTHKRSPVDLFAPAACCDDDDDDTGSVKKRTGSTVTLLHNVFEEAAVNCELKRTHPFSKYSAGSWQPVYIFQRELLI